VCTKEFKDEAAQLVVNGVLGLTEAARRLSISVKTLANWVAAAKRGTPVKAGVTRRPVTELEAENSQLKRALAEMKMERDLLKKATAYFAKESR
jgi:transposase